MVNLLKRFLNREIKEEPNLSEEELSSLGDEIQIWKKSKFWNLIISPMLDFCALKEVENMFTNGTKLSNEEKNQIIKTVNLTRVFKEEIEIWEDKCDQAKSSLAKKANEDTRKDLRR